MSAKYSTVKFEKRLRECMHDRRTWMADDVPGPAEALTVCAAMRATGKSVLWVLDGPTTLASRHRDLLSLDENLGFNCDLIFYPPWEALPDSNASQDPDIEGERLQALLRLDESKGQHLVVTSVQALMQPSLSKKTLADKTIDLKVGDEIDFETLRTSLVDANYSIEIEVTEKEQAAFRGGVVDIWPPAQDWPIRLEFFGEQLESARLFDPTNQRSVKQVNAANITPAGERATITANPTHGDCFFSHLPKDVTVVWSSPDSIESHADAYDDLARESGIGDLSISLNSLQSRVARRGWQELSMGAPAAAAIDDALCFTPLPGAAAIGRDSMEPDVMEETRRRFLDELQKMQTDGKQVMLFFDTEGSRDRFKETHKKELKKSKLQLAVGALSEGFANSILDLVVVSENDLYGRRKAVQTRYDPRAGSARPDKIAERVEGPSDLTEGDYVVHVQHGIARYAGVANVVFDGRMQEVLTLEYADDALLHVPVSHAHLLSKYIGVGERSVKVHRLGSKKWKKERKEANEAIRDFAASLLDIQASRQSLEGHAFEPDTKWQHEFEAAFPYRETPDQEAAIIATKKDMEGLRPMDRLVCGDVGFGKTEVAIRAAFKAVMDGKQVAVLVPTTVLCQQHFQTFSERMAAYPVRVEMLSRFRSKGKREATLKALSEGTVDIVVGTHGLLQPGVKFADLGLVIVDEEQRFGVKHKEKFKLIRQLIDVLTLTATPIPRTLYMSMIGIKDLSTVQTAPEHRLPISTTIAPNGDKVIRDAIMRELSRDGQAYFLYNRVMTIERVHARLKKLVPEARIGVGHGQMSAGELAEVMDAFVRGEYDVLLCTTIIESGLDIPNVNTIIIDRADRFGMADLYQLRGRVGRSTKKAYAYLLIPGHARIDPATRRRINMLKKYARLGSGFDLALRDLELRGGGNLLGTRQSGHVAAIGFLLYCQLLKRTVDKMQGKKVTPIVDVLLKIDFLDFSPENADAENATLVPHDYIADERLRIGTYRRIAEASTRKDIKELGTELADRFGPLPPPASRLMQMALIRINAAQRKIKSVETKGERILLALGGDDYVTKDGKQPRMKGEDTDAKLASILAAVRRA